MIVPAITLALAVTVALGFWFMCWDLDIRYRYGDELVRHSLRVQRRGPYVEPPSHEAMLDAVRVAMAITCRRYSARFAALIAERTAARDADRAHGMLESALAGSSAGLRVVR